MSDKELLLLGGGVFLFWLMTRRPQVTHTQQGSSLPTYNPNGAAAGLQPAANTPKDPSDPNNWLPGLVGGLAAAIPGIVSAAQKSSGPATSSGASSGTGISSTNSSGSTPDGWSDPWADGTNDGFTGKSPTGLDAGDLSLDTSWAGSIT